MGHSVLTLRFERERERTIEKEIPVVDFVVEPWRCLAAATGAVEMWRLLQ